MLNNVVVTFSQFLEDEATAALGRENQPGDATAAWTPARQQVQGMDDTKVRQLITQFVTNLVPNLVGPQNPQISPEQIQGIVSMFQTELQEQLGNYNPHNNLATNIQQIFRAGQRSTSRPGTTPVDQGSLAGAVDNLFRSRKH